MPFELHWIHWVFTNSNGLDRGSFFFFNIKSLNLWVTDESVGMRLTPNLISGPIQNVSSQHPYAPHKVPWSVGPHLVVPHNIYINHHHQSLVPTMLGSATWILFLRADLLLCFIRSCLLSLCTIVGFEPNGLIFYDIAIVPWYLNLVAWNWGQICNPIYTDQLSHQCLNCQWYEQTQIAGLIIYLYLCELLQYFCWSLFV